MLTSRFSHPAETLGPLGLLAQYGEDQEGASGEEEEEGAGRDEEQEEGGEAPPADDTAAIMIKLVEFIQVGGWLVCCTFQACPLHVAQGLPPRLMKGALLCVEKGGSNTSSRLAVAGCGSANCAGPVNTLSGRMLRPLCPEPNQ